MKPGDTAGGEASAHPVSGFAPVAAPDARLLILGTMPGQASLQQASYYAHPRNAFWPLMLAILAGEPLNHTGWQQWSYAARTALLVHCRVALWDVLAECIRPGSLDQHIAAQSIRANDLAGFVATHPQLQGLVFNGQGAATFYRRHAAKSVDAVLESRQRSLTTRTLPSTSPAMASKNLAQKFALWEPVIRAP